MYYDDDGQTYDYEKGVYYRQMLKLQQDGQTVRFRLDNPQGSYQPETETYRIQVHGVRADNVTFGGQAVTGVKTSNGPYGVMTELTIPFGSGGELLLNEK